MQSGDKNETFELVNGYLFSMFRERLPYFRSMAEETGVPYQNLTNLYLHDCAVRHLKLHMKWHPESAGPGA